MKAEEIRQVTTQAEASARNAGGAAMGAEDDVTTHQRTKAELEQASGLMDAVCERGNLKLAYWRVVGNKGAAGVDGIGVAEFKDHLKRHWPTIKAKLLAGEFMSRPVRRGHAIEELNPVLRGWAAYFKLTQTKSALEELDGWIRRELRCIQWRQWKRPYTRATNLMKAGLKEERAFRTAFNQRGPFLHLHLGFLPK
jgi:hypothetical protein